MKMGFESLEVWVRVCGQGILDSSSGVVLAEVEGVVERQAWKVDFPIVVPSFSLSPGLASAQEGFGGFQEGRP